MFLNPGELTHHLGVLRLVVAGHYWLMCGLTSTGGIEYIVRRSERGEGPIISRTVPSEALVQVRGPSLRALGALCSAGSQYVCIYMSANLSENIILCSRNF